MRAVKRGSKAAPSVLSQRGKDKLTELERAQAHISKALTPGTEREAFKFQAYKKEEVKRRLEELFHGKCAYCESYYAGQAPVDVEHYRPKGAVEGESDHDGYWWLGMEWTNLLPSCIDCNRRRKQKTPTRVGDVEVLQKTMLTGKKDCFPVAGTRAANKAANLALEEPLLLDPTRDDPEQHLHYWIRDGHGSGLILPKALGPQGQQLAPVDADVAVLAAKATALGLSVRGAVSIQAYGLNRLRMVQERTALLNRLRFFEYLVVQIGTVLQKLSKDDLKGIVEVEDAIVNLTHLQSRVLDEMAALASPKAPFSAFAVAYIRDFKQRLGSKPPG
ncbi:endonuclease [Rhizobium leguminosarum bv. viciae]|nr:endonuclease [Rhizobium leguminosarum bv. viciae]